MPRTKTTLPEQSREKNQRSLDLPLYLQRVIPYFNQPSWFNGNLWRKVVEHQPLAVACREGLISQVATLDWKVEPKDSEKRDELKSEIEYYTDFFTNTGEYHYTEIIEWIMKDMLDLPFGGAAELGYLNDDPEERLVWMKLLDGATLWPTLNTDWPVAQTLLEASMKTVYFPAHAINRIYLSPRTEIQQEGWGFVPAQKIYLAIEALNRGDYYYMNLLLDTPEAGILDLGDMEKSSAEEWVNAWRTMLNGIDPFKIPVLYEHEKPVEWIPFTRSPTDIMFDKAVLRYGAILTAGYGMTLSDIGYPSTTSGGDTLAGTIRNERISRRSGYGRAKNKVRAFFNKMLPKSLKYVFIELDDETSVAMGRARLASATALGLMVDKLMLSPEEARQQMIADGLINISIPEKLPAEIKKLQEQKNQFATGGFQSNERPALLGKPIAPSQGGYGEVRSEVFDYALANDEVFRSVYENLEGIFDQFPEETQILIANGLQRYLQKYVVEDNLLDDLDVMGDNLDQDIDKEMYDVTERQTEDATVGITDA